MFYSIKIWPARNSRLTQHEINHYIAQCASVLTWSCIAGRWPARLVIDLLTQHQRFAVFFSINSYRDWHPRYQGNWIISLNLTVQGGAKVVGQCVQLIVQLLLVRAQFFWHKICLNICFNQLHANFLHCYQPLPQNIALKWEKIISKSVTSRNKKIMEK